jgi:predicted nucleic acid-binding protein
MILLPDAGQVYSIWRTLVIANNVRGVQVHDAHLAATMLAHGVTRILTLNQPDFLRYAGLEAVHPGQLLAQKQSPE